jgi:hypothetical protein
MRFNPIAIGVRNYVDTSNDNDDVFNLPSLSELQVSHFFRTRFCDTNPQTLAGVFTCGI